MNLKYLKMRFLLSVQTLFAYLIIDRCLEINILLLNLDTLSVLLSAAMPCNCEDSIFIKKLIIRYIFVSYILAIKKINLRVYKKFPTLHSLVETGLLSDNEVKTLTYLKTTIKRNHSRILLAWAMHVMKVVWKESSTGMDISMNMLLVELTQHHCKLRNLHFDNMVSINFVYSLIAKLCTIFSIVLVLTIAKLFFTINNWVLFVHSYWACLFCILFMLWAILIMIFLAFFRGEIDDLELNEIINHYTKNMNINLGCKSIMDKMLKNDIKHRWLFYNLLHYTLEYNESIDSILEDGLELSKKVDNRMSKLKAVDLKDKIHKCVVHSCSFLQPPLVKEFESGFLARTDLGELGSLYKNMKLQDSSSDTNLNGLNMASRFETHSCLNSHIIYTISVQDTKTLGDVASDNISTPTLVGTNTYLDCQASNISDEISPRQTISSLDDQVSNSISTESTSSPKTNAPLDNQASNTRDSTSPLKTNASLDDQASNSNGSTSSRQTNIPFHGQPNIVFDETSYYQLTIPFDPITNQNITIPNQKGANKNLCTMLFWNPETTVDDIGNVTSIEAIRDSLLNQDICEVFSFCYGCNVAKVSPENNLSKTNTASTEQVDSSGFSSAESEVSSITVSSCVSLSSEHNERTQPSNSGKNQDNSPPPRRPPKNCTVLEPNVRCFSIPNRNYSNSDLNRNNRKCPPIPLPLPPTLPPRPPKNYFTALGPNGRRIKIPNEIYSSSDLNRNNRKCPPIPLPLPPTLPPRPPKKYFTALGPNGRHIKIPNEIYSSSDLNRNNRKCPPVPLPLPPTLPPRPPKKYYTVLRPNGRHITIPNENDSNSDLNRNNRKRPPIPLVLPPTLPPKKYFTALGANVRRINIQNENDLNSDINCNNYNSPPLPLPPPPHSKTRFLTLLRKKKRRANITKKKNTPLWRKLFHVHSKHLKCQSEYSDPIEHIYEEIDLQPKELNEIVEKYDDLTEEMKAIVKFTKGKPEKNDDKTEETNPGAIIMFNGTKYRKEFELNM